jgi:hypothetical protein
MKISLPRLLLISAIVALAPGCGKKEKKPAAITEAAPGAATETSPADESVRGTDAAAAAPTETVDAAAPTPEAAPEDPAMAGVPTELLASDQAYEAWFRKHKLELNDPQMLDNDEDKDGASNRDEFLANTDPRDPESRPGVHAGIRLKDYNEATLPLVLEEVQGGEARIRRTDDAGSKSETVRAGQTVRGTSYKVERVAARRDTDKHGEPTDRSQVVLTDSATKEKVVLVKNMATRSSASYATIMSEDGKTTRKVKQGEVFAWPEEGGTTYKVVDLREDQIVVQEVESNKTWTIPRK